MIVTDQEAVPRVKYHGVNVEWIEPNRSLVVAESENVTFGAVVENVSFDKDGDCRLREGTVAFHSESGDIKLDYQDGTMCVLLNGWNQQGE